MPSKPKLSKSAKEDLILSHIRSTGTCHTLKDLEKTLPSVASINGMQVKEYVQGLVDENKMRVEKIGTGNWYWCFASDEVKAKERELEGLRREIEKVGGSCGEVEGKVRALRERRALEEGCDGGDGKEEVEKERDELMETRNGLEREVVELRARLEEARKKGEGKSVGRMKGEIEELKQEAMMWTDNVYVLEEYVKKLAGGDMGVVRAVQQECYGEEYAEGEGLRELLT